MDNLGNSPKKKTELEFPFNITSSQFLYVLFSSTLSNYSQNLKVQNRKRSWEKESESNINLHTYYCVFIIDKVSWFLFLQLEECSEKLFKIQLYVFNGQVFLYEMGKIPTKNK